MITKNDLQILSHYQFIENGSNRQNPRLLGLKWIKEGSACKQKLVEVNRQDATCWALFLSLFGLGKLKHISVSLDKICGYLSHYQWKEIKAEVQQELEESPHNKAFKTVCHLANRHIKGVGIRLLKAVSDPIPSDFNHYWNPAMNGRFLLNLQRYRLPDAEGLKLRFKDSQEPVLANQKLTQEEIRNIEVGYEYELITEEETDYAIDEDDFDETTIIYYYHYPSSPYYSVDTQGGKLLPVRREL